ncbi:hypothetical protein OS493_039748 [Desmophyllum pertusum]|uniref:Uncharacterized protein n=1 Tax=Desmophyllum pertusum TaxID=174260 RepID=A0A9W9YTS8_9CNID|nr:hypothetical protein OS493_039748 [Desmophyllum pertusum]
MGPPRGPMGPRPLMEGAGDMVPPKKEVETVVKKDEAKEEVKMEVKESDEGSDETKEEDEKKDSSKPSSPPP